MHAYLYIVCAWVGDCICVYIYILNACMYIYIYVCKCISVYMCIYWVHSCVCCAWVREQEHACVEKCKYICMYVCILCVCISVCIYVYVCIKVYTYSCVYVCMVVYRSCVYVCLCEFMCLVACYSVSDLLGRSKYSNRRVEIVLVMDLIYWRFKDRSTRWSVDQYLFVQWRPDGDSVPKPRHFMWVFVLISFSSLPLLCFIRIISCDLILYFTSLTYCITSWDNINCSPYLFNWYELVSVSFHLLVNRRCWLRPSTDIP